MGIFTYIKIGVVVGLLLLVGFFVWSYQGMKTTIAMQKVEIETLEHNKKVLLQTVDTMRRLKDASDAIENAPNNDVADFLRTGVLPKTNNKVRTNMAPTTR